MNVNKRLIFQKALAEMKKDTGIDFYKVCVGDERENMRLRFRHWQERMRLSNGES